MAEETGSIGARLDLNLRAGDTLGPYTVIITDSTGAAVDVTSSTFSGGVSKLNDPDGDVAFTCTVINGPLGKVQFKLASTTTMGASTSNFFNTSATYSYYFRMVDTAGTKQTLLYGYVKVAKEGPT